MTLLRRLQAGLAVVGLALLTVGCSRSSTPATARAAGTEMGASGGTEAGASDARGGDVASSQGGVDAPSPAFDAAGCITPTPVTSCDGGWCAIPAGCFVMGSPPTEWGHPAVAEDQVAVTLTHSFEIHKHETTQAEWTSVGFANPSTQDKDAVDCTDAQCPVGHVTWFEALSYANELSQRAGLPACYALSGCTGAVGQGMVCTSTTITASTVYDCAGYRLPTDAEWEYAARAGTTTPFYSGDIAVYPTQQCAIDTRLDAIAWYCFNSGASSHPTQGKQPNRWGLYDMLGNLDEWVDDAYRGLPVPAPGVDPGSTWEPSSRVARIARGCDYGGWSTVCRVANQYSGLPSLKGFGFRLARTTGSSDGG